MINNNPVDVRTLEEWHEEDGSVLWWCWCNGEWLPEPPYVGSPLDIGHPVEVDLRHYEGAGRVKEMKLKTNVGGWPGYHTHWTPIPIPNFPASARKKADEALARERAGGEKASPQ